MVSRKSAPKLHPTAAPTMVVVFLLLLCVASVSLQSAGARTRAQQNRVFDLSGDRVLQDENHLGIVNGKLASGINYNDVLGVGGLWSPPYVSSNFLLDGRVGGEKVPTKKWNWSPFQVERKGRQAQVEVQSTTTLIYGHRAAVLEATFQNNGKEAVPLEFFVLGWLDQVQDWGFARPGSSTEAHLSVEGRRLILQQGKLALILAIDSDAWNWEASGNLGRAYTLLPAGRKHLVHVVAAMGAIPEAQASIERILPNPARAIQEAAREYARQVAEVFQKVPSLESDNAQLVRWYNRSLVHFLMNRWDVPEFALKPYYSTGSVNGGCVANYLWNFGEAWEILPLYDAPAARAHIQQFLRCDLLKHFYFTPITGEAGGLWYMINQEKIIGLTYYYVLLTGDTGFLHAMVDGKSIRDHMTLQAMFGDDPNKPIGLIDYGPSNSHLELRRRYAYNHVMPDLNARRYASYLRAATLCDLAGQPAPYLRERAALLQSLLKTRLWDADARWFRFEDGQGKGDLRYTVQMFKPIGSGVLDQECEAGLLSHLNESEFLSNCGLHSLSKRDPAYDQLDIDNGGGGICTSFPPQIIERLCQAGRPDKAADILRRLLWWADVMPYWGDSIAANYKDYRRDTPLQCTFDGVAAAQCVIFGVFGVSIGADGNIMIRPAPLPFARHLRLRGLHLRGHTLDIEVNGDRFKVRSEGRTLRASMGQTLKSADLARDPSCPL